MKKIFIFGTGRCGTKTLDELFGSIPHVFSNHEGIYYDRKGNQKTLGNLRELNGLIYYKNNNHSSDLYEKTKIKNISNNDVFVKMESLFSRRNDFIKKYNQLHYVDINPYSYLFIDYILYKYPDSKFIHVVRDGREVVRSFHERMKTTYPPDKSEAEYSGWSAAKPRPFLGDPLYNDWPEYDRFKKVCFFWNFVNREIINRFKNIKKENKIFLRLEDLSESKFSKVLNKLDISDKFDKSKLAVHNVGKKRKFEWSEDRLEFFWKINKDLMNRFGYK